MVIKYKRLQYICIPEAIDILYLVKITKIHNTHKSIISISFVDNSIVIKLSINGLKYA